MKVLIVEDETAAAESLSYMLRKIMPDVEIAAYSESVEQTVEILSSNQQIDLIFMDIHLSDGSAFSIFNRIVVNTPVIFTTAYDQYALEAFKVNSIDYLLKPIKKEDLQRAVGKFRQRSTGDLLEYISAMTRLAPRNPFPGRLILPVKDKLIPVTMDSICYIYSTNRKTEVVLANGNHIEIRKSLEQLQSSLNPEMFRRANKQFIIAKQYITELSNWFDNRLLVRMAIDTPEEIFISKNSVSDFKKWLTE